MRLRDLVEALEWCISLMLLAVFVYLGWLYSLPL